MASETCSELERLRKQLAAASGIISRLHGLLRLSHAESTELMIAHLDTWITREQVRVTNNSLARGYLYLCGAEELKLLEEMQKSGDPIETQQQGGVLPAECPF